jgi:hypothetical protein
LATSKIDLQLQPLVRRHRLPLTELDCAQQHRCGLLVDADTEQADADIAQYFDQDLGLHSARMQDHADVAQSL